MKKTIGKTKYSSCRHWQMIFLVPFNNHNINNNNNNPYSLLIQYLRPFQMRTKYNRINLTQQEPKYVHGELISSQNSKKPPCKNLKVRPTITMFPRTINFSTTKNKIRRSKTGTVYIYYLCKRCSHQNMITNL